MARRPRKKLKFDEESLNGLLQEIYDESHNIKAKIVRLFNKWEIKAKDGGEIAAFGDQIIKLINAEAKNQDQKIMLLKYLKDVINENKTGVPTTEKEGDRKVLDGDSKDVILEMLEKERLKKK